MSSMSAFRRAEQWRTFSRNWYLYDAQWQDAFDSAERVARYLHGRHKPIYDTFQDVGDHVVVINARHIAMPGDEWRWRYYYHHTQYGGGQTWASAWQLHHRDPTLVLYKAIYKAVGTYLGLRRREYIARLHIFPDAVVPKHIMVNISDQIRQLRPVHKKLSDYTKEELEKYPKLFDYPDNYSVK